MQQSEYISMTIYVYICTYVSICICFPQAEMMKRGIGGEDDSLTCRPSNWLHCTLHRICGNQRMSSGLCVLRPASCILHPLSYSSYLSSTRFTIAVFVCQLLQLQIHIHLFHMQVYMYINSIYLSLSMQLLCA